MARKNLSKSLELMFGHEGGYSNNPNDKGGPTKFGITHKTLAAHRGLKSVTAAQVKSLGIEEATAIYVKSYWNQGGGDLLPSGLDYAVFDASVNSGPVRAVKILQKVIGFKDAAVDGAAGDQTLTAVKNYAGGIEKLIRDYCDERMRFLKGLSDWKHFGRGWQIRVTGTDPQGKYKQALGVVGNALIMARAEKVNTKVEPVVEELPTEIETGKAPVSNTSLSTIAIKPELAGPIVAGAGTLITPFASGSVILQATLAFVVVVAVIVGAYFVVKRIRRD
jgi:lysozyme family protein